MLGGEAYPKFLGIHATNLRLKICTCTYLIHIIFINFGDTLYTLDSFTLHHCATRISCNQALKNLNPEFITDVSDLSSFNFQTCLCYLVLKLAFTHLNLLSMSTTFLKFTSYAVQKIKICMQNLL